MGTFQMPEFNFRLRRALDPFSSQISPSVSQSRNPWNVSMYNPQQQEDEQELPSFDSSMPDYSQFYQDSGPAQDKYKSYLDKVPNPQDYAPTKWRRLGAILSGTSAALGGKNGYEVARNIVRDPYETAYEDWGRGGQGLKEAATMEEASAAKKATLYQKILSDYMDAQRWERDYEIKMKNATTAEERNELTRIYNEGRIKNDAERNRLTGVRDQATAGYRNRMAGIAAGNLDVNRGRLDETRRSNLDDAFIGLLNADSNKKRADAYGGYMNRPSYSSAGDMQRFEIDATREYLALNPDIAEMVDVDDYGRIDYESIDDPAVRAKVVQDIQRGVKAKQSASMRPGR